MMDLNGGNPVHRSDISRDYELVLAAGNGEYAIVKQKLEDGVPVDTRSPPPPGKFNNWKDEVQEDDDHRWLLIDSWLEGSIRVEKTNFARTALQAAADGGYEDIVTLLIDAGADVNAPPAPVFGRTALQAAAGSGYEQVVKLLIAAGAHVNASPAEQYGRTALQAASEGGYESVVGFLILSGAHVDAPPGEKFGRTALQAAAGGGFEEVVRILLDSHTDVNAPPAACGGRTALQTAAERGHGSVVALLIDSGADVDAPPAGSFGTTALHGAAEGGHEEVLMLLAEARVYTGGACSTILHDAVDDDNRLKLLLNLGLFDINAKDFLGSTALHIAVKRSKLTAVKLLVDEDAEIDTTDISGETPLQTALGNGSIEILDLLLKNGAMTNGLRVDRYLSLLGVGDFQDGGCAVILREESPQCRIVERSSWCDTEIKDLKDEKWSLPSICLFNSAFGSEHLGNPNSYADPYVYLKAYHGQRQPSVGNEVRWSWLTIGNNHNQSPSYPEKFQVGVPNRQGMSPQRNAEVILVAYVSFNVPAQRYHIDLKMEPFELMSRKIEISWVMRESDSPPDTSRDPLWQFGAHEKLRGSFMRKGTFNSGIGPLTRTGTFNSTKGTFDAPRGSFLRSVSYRGTLKVKYLKIPRHGVEFFILFLDYIHQNWLELIEKAKLHLVKIRDAQLRKGGQEPKIIECLLKDSQQWNNLRADLGQHVLKSEEVLNRFRRNDALYMELVDPDNWQQNIGELPAIQDLAKRIQAFEKDCKDRISELANETKDMIELEFSLVSIAEARRSIEMSMSMKRLSWITFIFLPLMFCSGLFGMNVDVLESYPSWLWYPALAVPILSSVLVVWLLFKYIPVGNWIERNIGLRLEAKLKEAGAEKIPPSPYGIQQGSNPWGSSITAHGDAATMGSESPRVSGWRQACLRAKPTRWMRRKSKGRNKDEEYDGEHQVPAPSKFWGDIEVRRTY